MKKIITLSVVCVLLALIALPTLLTKNSEPTGDMTVDSTDEKMNDFEISQNESPILTTDSTTDGGLSMAKVFASGMVLQRQEPINVYGFANEGSTVTVTLGTETLSTTAVGGEWKVTFPAREAAKGLTLTVSAGDEVLTFSDVDIGEVFVISGQSNAQYSAYQLEDWDEISRLTDTYQNIRIYAETSTWTIYPAELGFGVWMKATKDNLAAAGIAKGNVSALGYVMATKLAAELGPEVTVAIINVARSATKISAWLPREVFDEDPEFYKDEIARYDNYKAFWDANGRWPTSTDESTYYQSGSNPYSYIPCLSYNAMIAQMKGYTARAVVWYQGESDGRGFADQYPRKYAALQAVFSEAFGNDDIPFFLIQIAPYNTDVEALAYFESVQYDLTLNNPNTYLVSTGVDGSPMHSQDMEYGPPSSVIHPSRKSPLGYRTADRIMVELFGKEGEILTAPQLTSVTKGEGNVTLTFDTQLRLLWGVDPTDFEVYDASSEEWVKVKATMSGNTVVLDTSALTDPTQVRYGFGGRYIELATGELLRLDVGSNLVLIKSESGKYAQYTDPETGKVYEFRSEDGQIVRVIKSGNLTNASGEAMPTFTATIY